MEKLIEATPSELRFTVRPDQDDVLKMTLRSAVGDSGGCVVFKVRTTNPERYYVNPASGVIPAGESVTTSVVLQRMDPPGSDLTKIKDKFQLVAVPIPVGSPLASKFTPGSATLVEDINALLASPPQEIEQSIAHQKFRCHLTLPAAAPPTAAAPAAAPPKPNPQTSAQQPAPQAAGSAQAKSATPAAPAPPPSSSSHTQPQPPTRSAAVPVAAAPRPPPSSSRPAAKPAAAAAASRAAPPAPKPPTAPPPTAAKSAPTKPTVAAPPPPLAVGAAGGAAAAGTSATAPAAVKSKSVAKVPSLGEKEKVPFSVALGQELSKVGSEAEQVDWLYGKIAEMEAKVRVVHTKVTVERNAAQSAARPTRNGIPLGSNKHMHESLQGTPLLQSVIMFVVAILAVGLFIPRSDW